VILVTGGTGFIGRALVPALAERGYNVCVLTHRRNSPIVPRPDVLTRQADLLEPRSLPDALDGISTVIHLAAALPDARLPETMVRRLNVDGTRNLARAAAHHGIQQFVHCSSAGVYGDGREPGLRDESSAPDPGSVYEKTKLESEQALAEELSLTSVSWIALRPTGVHGPGRASTAEFYQRICRQRVWLHGPATVVVHPTYVGDVVRAIVLSLERRSLTAEVMNIAGECVFEYPRLIEFLARRLGVRVRQLRVRAPFIRPVARVGVAVLGQFGGAPAALERLTRPIINRSVDTSKARRLLGFEPYPFEQGIDDTIEWARQERRL
jgi:nucleoside-diphosphate-sugar epimerase